ncbi:hypothetical protein [Candidatus Frankia alpina]|uniref:Uncharacterized protein n=1 Tax=Candidatus Frankia alpina TaxID=2699483 RepID=A0A4S5CT19_9ACTN|nr:hypothetical protein [Candidatus Frankia alpina]THJ48181.1 hypothetical protein E7Y31_19385 [Candidatus Frankia alpina]
MLVPPSHLSQLGNRAGLGIADVALLAGVDESTISRLWSTPDWLDRVRGRTLQALIAAVPGVAEYVADAPQRDRFASLVRSLAAEGVTVDLVQAARLSEQAGVPRPYVAHALEALFQGGLLVDVAPLLTAATELIPRLASRSYSFNMTLAQAHLAHHVAKVTGAPSDLGDVSGDLDRRAAFTLRSNTMGALAATANIEPAEQYHRLVETEPAVRMVEEWAFPSWMRDCRPSADMSVPGSILLRQTAAEVLREIGSYGEGYLHYLVSTYLPLALSQDPTFGLRAGELHTALLLRRDTLDNPIVRRSVDTLTSHLPTGVS